jgi:lichenan operon transcriptional antiterminator
MKLMIQQNEHRLLEYLFKNDTCPASQCARFLAVSKRSIINYVAALNSSCPGLIKATSQGYQLDTKKGRQVLKDLENQLIPQNSVERVRWLITKLLHARKPLSLIKLSEELCVSEATLKSDIKQVRQSFAEYGLLLKVKDRELYFSGPERSVRKMISSFLYDESKAGFLDENMIDRLFPDIDIKKLSDRLGRILHENELYFNDYSFFSLLLHLAIMIDRVQNGYCSEEKPLPMQPAPAYQQVTNDIQELLQKSYGIQIIPAEIKEILSLILSRTTPYDFQNTALENLSATLGSDYIAFVKEVLAYINDFYYVNTTNQDFIIRFAIHLANLLQRSQVQNYSHNAIIPTIKKSCPLIYELSVSVSQMIYNRFHVQINDDEIAFVALHIGAALEDSRKTVSTLTCALLCPRYYDLDMHISQKIGDDFQKDVRLENIYTQIKPEEDYGPVDFLISTVPTDFKTLPSIVINPLYTRMDYDRIYSLVAKLKTEKKHKAFQDHLSALTRPEFFFVDEGLTRDEEVIPYLCEKLRQEGYVEADFAQRVFEREKLSSTVFDEVAIPHSFHLVAKRSVIAVLKDENKISWNNQEVSLVLLLAISPSDQQLFYDMFEGLTYALSIPECFHELQKAKTLSEFVKILVRYA